PVRDSYIRQYTLTSLMPKASKSLNVRLFDRYYAELNSRYEAVRKEYVLGDIIGKVKKGLEAHTPGISSLTLEDDSIDATGRGLKKIYKQALMAMETAMKESTPENMHKWRKKTKYLWYQVKMLKLIWPGIMGNLGKEIHQLSDYLGDEHDLSVLSDTLNDKKYQGDSMVHSVKTFALDRKEYLSDQAVSLGSMVFCESPGRFSDRILSYWKVSLGKHTTG
ncbi:MAG TPA: CHAD domain-containing protein, partial [Bacteroidales bacterium]|nr:CHAD domain-containing protein [Bacteroidales bacterium]